MSYAQFGYSYPTSSQLLMTGQHAAASYCDATPAAMTADSHPGQPPTATLCSLPTAYESRLLSTYPRLASGLTVNGLYGSTYADQAGYMASFGSNPAALYTSSLATAYDLKDARPTWPPLSQATCYPYDPSLSAYNPYGDRFDPVDSAARRRNATRETTSTLKAWLNEHRKNPYPTKGEKIMLAIITKMTLTQVSTWFANARRRLKKENKMTWEPKNKSSDPVDDYDKVNDLSGNEDDDDDDEKGKKGGEEENVGRLSADEKEGLDKRRTDLTGESRPLHQPESANYNRRSPVTNGSSGDCRKTAVLRESPSPEEATRPVVPSERPSNKMATDGSRSTESVCSSGDRDGKPKIWSLAHTATSESPPPLRRSPFQPQPPRETSKPSHYGALFNERVPSSDFRGNPPELRYQDSPAESSLSPPGGWTSDAISTSDTPGSVTTADVGPSALDLNVRSTHVTVPVASSSPVSSPTFGYRMLPFGQKGSPYPTLLKAENCTPSPPGNPVQVTFGSPSLLHKSPPPLIRYSVDCTPLSSSDLLSRPKMEHRERGTLNESRDFLPQRPGVPDRLGAVGLGSTAFRPVARR